MKKRKATKSSKIIDYDTWLEKRLKEANSCCVTCQGIFEAAIAVRKRYLKLKAWDEDSGSHWNEKK